MDEDDQQINIIFTLGQPSVKYGKYDYEEELEDEDEDEDEDNYLEEEALLQGEEDDSEEEEEEEEEEASLDSCIPRKRSKRHSKSMNKVIEEELENVNQRAWRTCINT